MEHADQALPQSGGGVNVEGVAEPDDCATVRRSFPVVAGGIVAGGVVGADHARCGHVVFPCLWPGHLPGDPEEDRSGEH